MRFVCESEQLSGDFSATMKVCRVCLAMGVKMYQMSDYNLSVVFERVTGVEINMEDKLPKMLCWECFARLSSAHHFIKKATKTHLILVNKIKDSKFISMDDIELIDKTQLKSTLGVKFYRDNYSYTHLMESDNFHKEEVKAEFDNNVEEQIFVPQDIVIAEKDPIKREYPDGFEVVKVEDKYNIETDISNESVEIQFQNTEFKIETFEISVTEDTSDASRMSEEGNYIMDKTTEVYDQIKQNRRLKRTKALPHCKEPRVLLEDIMLTFNKHNTQDTFKNLTDNDQRTKNNNETFCQGTVNGKILFKDNCFETLNYSMDTLRDTVCKNSSISYPESTSQVVKIRSGSVKNNISPNNATSSKKLLVGDKALQIETSLKQHSRKHPNKTSNSKHTNNTDFTCKYCTYETNFKSRLKYHIKTKHPKSTFNCAHCDFVTNIKRSLIGHINAKHTKNIVFNCSYCNYKTYVKPNLNIHINTKHTKNNIFNCSYCNYKTYIKPNLNTHINNKHTKINIYKCSFCDYKVYNKLTFNRHVNAKHTKTNVFNCPDCSFKSYRQCQLNAHVNAKHNKLNVQ